jgi:hypothetical protein
MAAVNQDTHWEISNEIKFMVNSRFLTQVSAWYTIRCTFAQILREERQTQLSFLLSLWRRNLHFLISFHSYTSFS